MTTDSVTSPFPPAAQRADVPPFHVMDVLSAAKARQAERGDVVFLCAGQPTAGAPEPVLAAAHEALRGGDLGYTTQLGIPPLREAIAGHYDRAYGLDVDPADVIVTTGSSGGFLLAFLSAFEAGDRVAMARPGYPAYRNLLSALGCEVVEFSTDESTRFQPTPEILDGLGDIKGLIVASPSNPTGTIVSPGELAVLTEWCTARGVRLISDEIYHGISYERDVACAWQTSRESLVLGSFSKYFAMTGWRLGWMLAPRSLHRSVDVLTGNFNICPPALSQHAAVAALSPESHAELDGHVDHYRANRDLLLDGLRGIGLTRIAPIDGAFYAYVDVSEYTDDSLSWCRRLLEDTGVAITPGVDFDPVAGGSFVRLSFAGARADIVTAVERMGTWLGS